ncbi:cytidylate kinase family protein [Candidatus Woesearchaeota archaeon]|nr:cytidylate kinase family protein [Candidatus Woesearchaeota archaeon]
MIITISGLPGSGKSTVAKMLGKKLGYKHYSTGDFMGELAMKRGMSVLELSKLAEKDTSIDKALDDRQVKLGKEENDFVIDSRLGFHFIPNSVKIFLDVDPDAGAKRVFGDLRPDEKENTSLAAAKENIKKRIESERKRYKKYYGIDCYDKKHYDIVIDTTKRTPEQVIQRIVEELQTAC